MFLNCHTHFSFKYGTLSVDRLVAEAKNKKLDALALTDINSSAAVFPFIRAAQKAGIHPVIGIDFRNGIAQQYIGLARNQEGMYELNKHLSEHLIQQRPFADKAPPFENSFVVYPFPTAYFSLAEHEFIGIHTSQLNKLRSSPWYRKREYVLCLLYYYTCLHLSILMSLLL